MVFVISVLSFLIVYKMGDPAELLASPTATPEDIARTTQAFGLDKPFHLQYLTFLSRLAVGDLGDSFVTGDSAVNSILQRFPATIELAVAAMLLTLLVGVPLGIITGARPKSLFSKAIGQLAILGISIPGFWLGLVLIMVFSVGLGWVPAGGRGTVATVLGVRSSLFTLDGWHHIILPAITLATFNGILLFRLSNTGTREALSSDYVKYARSKGVSEARILGRYVLPNILIPISTVAGLEFGSLLVFAAVTETIFAWPGMGKLIVDSIGLLDRPVITAYLMITIFIILIVNLLVDLINIWLDPRLRTNSR
jgi:peptide/nickel transport system permease protein